MLVKVVLVDVNPKMIQAWQNTFEENSEVDVVLGSILDQNVSAWVSPTNARGHMGGGLDAIIKKHLGPQIETSVQQDIRRLHSGFLPVGYATCVPTSTTVPHYLISTPTMAATKEDVSDTLNVALACAAAFQAVHMQNVREPGSIRAVALPGLGANNGKVPVEICADLMWTAYNMFREQEFTSFADMRDALEEQLGDLGPDPTTPKFKKKPGSNFGSPAPTVPPPKKQDVDFDDSE